MWQKKKKKITPVCRFFHRNEVFVVLNVLFNKDLSVHSLSGSVCWELGLQRGANRQDCCQATLSLVLRDRHFKNCKQYEGKEQDAVRKCHRSLTQKNATFELRLVGIPWQSSGEDSMLSLLRAWVQSRVGELKCHNLHSTAKTKKRRPRTCKMSRS